MARSLLMYSLQMHLGLSMAIITGHCHQRVLVISFLLLALLRRRRGLLRCTPLLPTRLLLIRCLLGGDRITTRDGDL